MHTKRPQTWWNRHLKLLAGGRLAVTSSCSGMEFVPFFLATFKGFLHGSFHKVLIGLFELVSSSRLFGNVAFIEFL